MAECIVCNDTFPDKRKELGYATCLSCGDQQAKQARESWCVAPMHKSNYQLITNKEELIGLNNKGGQPRLPN